jgi:hypothetical protein
MSNQNKDEPYSEDEIALLMNNAVRRALNTSPKPHKEMAGKSERKKATAKPKSRVRKASQSNPKLP